MITIKKQLRILIIVFHFLVISGVIPSGIVWGGNIADKKELWRMELISIVANVVMLLFVCAYAGLLKVKLRTTAVKVGFWIMFALFMLNTLGNILSKNPLETYIVMPLTLLLSLFCFRIAAFDTKEQYNQAPNYV
jgi:hypothetical protein